MNTTVWFVAAAAIVGSAAGAAAKPHPFVEGEPLPELMLPSAEEGRPRFLAEFRGHKTVFHVFASW